MPADGVYWSSAVSKGRFFWFWTAAVYKTPQETIRGKGGWCFSIAHAERKRDEWLESMGESP